MDTQERIPRFVYQLRFQLEHERDHQLIKAVLLNLGYGEGDFVSSVLKGRARLELFDERQAKLKGVEKLFRRLKLAGVKISRHCLYPKDWLTLWKRHWKPAPLTKKLDVVPVWCKDKYKPRRGKDCLFMDTLLSFGTGLHETTRFVAQFIEGQRGQFQSFLDIGTGTGILALVAIIHGAQDVAGIDIGSLSVQAARDNMKANQLFFKVKKADIKNYANRKAYDFVAANLITEDLIEHAGKITRFVKPGGLLAISGISLENLAKLRRAFSALPLSVLTISKGQQWSGILYQKKK